MVELAGETIEWQAKTRHCCEQARSWWIERADRFAFIVDAVDYFETARAPMLGARKNIFLIRWDFDAPHSSGPRRR
jgi:hypothetical protein